MSFEDSFAKGFMTSYQQASKDASDEAQLEKRLLIDAAIRKKEKLEKRQEEEKKHLATAKTVLDAVGGPPEGLTFLFDLVKGGATATGLLRGFGEGTLSFQGIPTSKRTASAPTGGGSTTSRTSTSPGTVDEQTTSVMDTAPADADVIPMRRSSAPPAAAPLTSSSTAPTAAPNATGNTGVATDPVTSSQAPVTPSNGTSTPAATNPDGTPRIVPPASPFTPLYVGNNPTAPANPRAQAASNLNANAANGPLRLVVTPKAAKGAGGEKPDKSLTPAEVAAEYAYFAQRALSGDPKMVKEFEDYKATTYKTKMDALAATKLDKGGTDFVEVSVALDEALASGNPARIAAAQTRFDRVTKALVAQDQMKESGKGIQIYNVVNGKAEFRDVTAVPNQQGGIDYVDMEGKRVEGSGWKRLTKEQDNALEAVYKTNNAEVSKYKQSQSDLASTVRLTGDVLDIVNKQPEALTRVAQGVKAVVGGAREAVTAVGVLRDLMGKDGKGVVQLGTFERTLKERGLLEKDQSLEALANTDTSKITDLASARAILEAKLILLTFRSGSLEGQSGNAMSNKDFDRLTTIVNASSGSDTFRKNLTSYVKGLVDRHGDMAFQLNDRATGLAGNFQERYGFSPGARHVIPFEDFIDTRKDPNLKRSYQMILSGGRAPAAPASTNTTTPQQQQATPAATTRRTPPPQVEGRTFVGYAPDGKAVYKDANGQMFKEQ